MLTGMRPLVYLEVLRPGENLAAARKRAGERFLAGVHSYVIDEFVFGLEGPTVPRTTLPEAGVRRALGSTHVLHRQVAHNVREIIKHLAADFRPRRVRVQPHAGHLFPLAAAADGANDRGRTAGAVVPHVPEEGTLMTGVRHRRMLLMDRRRGQVRSAEILMMRRKPRVLGILSGIVARQWMLARVMGELLHRRAIVMQRREEAQSALRRGRTHRVVLLPSKGADKVARRVTRMVTHVMAHVRCHVGRRVRMMGRITLVMKMMMLLRGGLASRG